MQDLTVFKNIVKSQARNFPSNKINTREDIEQECWLKLVEVMPKLQEVSDTEAIFMAHTILKNHVASIIRSEMTRSHLNCSYEPPDEISVEDAIANQIYEFAIYIPQSVLPQEEVCAFRQLINDIKDWTNSQDDKTQKLVNELVFSSEATIQAAKDMFISHRYKYDEFLPPAMVGRIHNISKAKSSAVMKELRFYLETIGYNNDYRSEHSYQH